MYKILKGISTKDYRQAINLLVYVHSTNLLAGSEIGSRKVTKNGIKMVYIHIKVVLRILRYIGHVYLSTVSCSFCAHGST